MKIVYVVTVYVYHYSTINTIVPIYYTYLVPITYTSIKKIYIKVFY